MNRRVSCAPSVLDRCSSHRSICRRCAFPKPRQRTRSGCHQTEQAEVPPALQDCRRRRRWHQALERAACSVQGCRAAPISILAALRLGVAQTRSVGTARWVRSLHSRSRRYPRGLRRERRRRCRGSPASRLFAWPYRTCSRHSRKDPVMVDAPPFSRRDPIVRRAAHDTVSLFRR